jgi:predicted Zn-dependent protease
MVIGDASPGLARNVLRGLPAPWRRDRIEYAEVEPSTLIDRTRWQADALRVLALVPEDADRFWVGLASFDLTLAPLAYVCGVAPLGGRRGVVSWARLREGIGPDSPRFLERVIKEVTHELGHAAGLVHCVVHDCVMRASIRPDEMDLKRVDYCPFCEAALRAALAGAGIASSRQ